MTVSLILNGVVAALLVATIVYAIRLNSRLETLRKGKEEFGTFIADFNKSVASAEAALAQLREASGETGGELKHLVGKAQALRDDLSFLMERGAGIADRLESAPIRQRSAERSAERSAVKGGFGSNFRAVAKRQSQAPSPAKGLFQGTDAKDQKAQSQAAQELMKALQSTR